MDLIKALARTYNVTPGKHHTLEKSTGVVLYSTF